MAAIIETENLTKVLGTIPVVNHVSLQISEGTVYGLVGANGAGKSTLLRLIVGYYWPTTGNVRLFGEVLSRQASAIRQRIHMVSAGGEVFKTYRVRDLIQYYNLLYDRFDNTRCTRLLDALELSRRSLVRQLSLGMKTQLKLALALACHPDILLLDEPTNGLDPVVKRQFLQILVQEVAHAGTTILLATHHLDDLDCIADGVAVMYKGQLIADGLLNELKERVKEIHAVLPGRLPEEVRKRREVISHEQKGQLHILVVDGPPDAVLETLRESGAIHVETIDLSFVELFRYLMEREGYTRDAVLLY